MALECFCGENFSSIDTLYYHVVSEGHRIQCCSGHLFGTRKQLADHQKSVRHNVKLDCTVLKSLKGLPGQILWEQPEFKCGSCHGKLFRSLGALMQHIGDTHPSCPTCNQMFRNKNGNHARSGKEKLHAHQRHTGHCYCAEHEIIFGSEEDFKAHKREFLHTTGFECVDCDRQFDSEQALISHLSAKIHDHAEVPTVDSERIAATLAAVEEANLRCESCERTFISLAAFRQHKASVKHNPLSDLFCPMSTECTQHFTSPSALIFHLESGACKSGMNRVKLNHLVHRYDSGRQITSGAKVLTEPFPDGGLTGLGAATSGLSELDYGLARLTDAALDLGDYSGGLAGSVADSEESESSGVILTPSVSSLHRSSSSASGVLLTPTASSHALSEWSHIEDGCVLTPSTSSIADTSSFQIAYGSVNHRWPCYICGKTFRKEAHLKAHLNSPAHLPKIFHCPTALLGLSNTNRILEFKTLSGLAQHIEAGACAGGHDLLKTIVDIFENKIKTATGKEVRLLRDSA